MYVSVKNVLISEHPLISLPFFSPLLQYLLSAEQKATDPAKSSSFVLDDALHHMWKAHVVSIAYALPKFRDRYGNERGGQGDLLTSMPVCEDSA